MSALRILPFLACLALGGLGTAYYLRSNPNPLSSAKGMERPRHDSATAVATPSPAAGSTEKVVGIGYADVEGGATPLSLPLPGAVSQIFIREGQRVRKGDPLVRLHDAKA